MSRFFPILLSLALIFSLAGCSSNPATPSDQGTVDDISIPAANANETSHALLGSWIFDFNLESLTVNITPDRSTNAHFNVTSFIPPPGIIINSYDPVMRVLDVDVTITNSSGLVAYDVRGIVYTDNNGHTLIDADGWTSLFDIPGGEDINPFMAYTKHRTRRIFPTLIPFTEKFLLYIPPAGGPINYAIDASWPGNCEEPYSIENFQQGILNDQLNAQTEIEVDVLDWQDNVSYVYLQCMEITNQLLTPLTKKTPTTWGTTLTNSTGVSEGVYEGCIIAYSGAQILYNYVNITVTHVSESGWARTWGGTGYSLDFLARSYDTTTDSSDNIFVTGNFWARVDFDPGPGVDRHMANGNYCDAFLSKFDSNGDFIWARTWGGTLPDWGTTVETDAEGNVFVLGRYNGTVDFDPGPGVFENTTAGEDAPFLSKFDSDGNFEWAAFGFGYMFDKFATDSMGNVYVTYFWNYRYVYMDKLDPDGNEVLSLTWGGTSGLSLGMTSGVYIDDSDGVYVSGNFKGTFDFDPGPGGVYRTSQYYSGDYKESLFLVKFNSEGNYRWVQTWHGPQSYRSYFNYGLAGNGSGDIVTMYVGNFSSGYFWAKYDSTGVLQWGDEWSWGAFGLSNTLALDNDGNIYLTGEFEGTKDFYPGTGTAWRSSTGGTDIFLGKYNPDGNMLWIRTWGSTLDDEGEGVTVDNSGNVYSAGHFLKTIDFDPGSSVDEHTASDEYSGAFLMKLLPDGYWE